MEDYRSKDDLNLYDAVIEEILISHRERSISFQILKPISRLDRHGGFTYRVKKGMLKFENVIYANIPYSFEWDEWSEFYRSAVLDSSKVIDRIPTGAKKNKTLKHIYLGIDYGRDYKELDIVCSNYSLSLHEQEYILHDDFDWLYEE
ncbi:hypothetical protein [Lysinibacillus sp. SGAir0095]|uniref:hypothetical protein n=1 Tax=Lysinibacillus sp. SGAir0095 TaxID=2070463 RepID=UPI0010CD2F2B|nr:hypothetical protein [Lysinibacillus sp. SGAir0095]QCR31968.1 hypothetical protein C1N55_07185 [Lysinibacillus sp. SGAir0095]